MALIVAPISAPVAARSPGDIAEVWNGLLAVAVGHLIEDNCATISPRLIRVYTLRNQLIAAARSAGFADDEIRAFVENRGEQKRLEAEARAYLAARDVDKSSPAASYCPIGSDEIAAGSPVGRLLREN